MAEDPKLPACASGGARAAVSPWPVRIVAVVGGLFLGLALLLFRKVTASAVA